MGPAGVPLVYRIKRSLALLNNEEMFDDLIERIDQNDEDHDSTQREENDRRLRLVNASAPYSSTIIEREGNDPICVEVIGAGSAEYVHGLRDFNDSGESRRWAFDSSDAVLLSMHKTVVE